MGMDLVGKGGDFRFNIFGWRAVLALAQMNGWKPAGTVLEGEAGWAGGYDTNDGQTVTSEDAAQLADAVEQALPDIPDHDALEHKGQIKDIPGLGPTKLFSLTENISPVEMFSGDGKEHLRQFIVYCRAGSFQIW
jgi:hypothetical protein